jgi:hypothetical protein
MATRALPALVVYSRDGCHLCDEMIAGLRQLRARFSFTLEIVDIDTDPVLEAHYGEHVPVLLGGGRELCRHDLEPDRVTWWLRHGQQASQGGRTG